MEDVAEAPGYVSERKDMAEVPGYVLERKLGRGGEGVVWLGKRVGGDGKLFAVKTRQCHGLEAANEAIQEALALARVTGPQNVAIHDVILAKGCDNLFLVHLVMDYLTGGDLDNYLHEGKAALSYRESVVWLNQLLSGLDRIHKSKLVHRDLKPENIFISESNQLMIGDMGLAKQMTSDSVDGVEGTTIFMAPEVLSGEGATEKSDVFSLGVVLFEMLVHESMARARKSLGLIALAEKSNWNPESLFPVDVKGGECSVLVSLCASMLALDPVKRPSVTELLFTTSKLCASLQSRVSASFSANEVSRLELSFSIRPMRKGEEVEAASVLARAYERDPRFYYWTYAVEAEKRMKITRQLMDAVVAGALQQKAVWLAISLNRIVGVMICMSPEDKKRPPLSVLLTSGWKLLKHTKLLLPGMKLYKTAMAEVDRVFPDQRSEWFVVQLGIEPSFQARGIGKCLLTTVTKWAEEQGTRVNALVFHHRQVAFLERFGFQVCSKCEQKDQPTFFTLKCSPVRAKPVQISARGSAHFSGSPVVATLTRVSGVKADAESGRNSNNDGKPSEDVRDDDAYVDL